MLQLGGLSHSTGLQIGRVEKNSRSKKLKTQGKNSRFEQSSQICSTKTGYSTT